MRFSLTRIWKLRFSLPFWLRLVGFGIRGLILGYRGTWCMIKVTYSSGRNRKNWRIIGNCLLVREVWFFFGKYGYIKKDWYLLLPIFIFLFCFIIVFRFFYIVVAVYLSDTVVIFLFQRVPSILLPHLLVMPLPSDDDHMFYLYLLCIEFKNRISIYFTYSQKDLYRYLHREIRLLIDSLPLYN